MEQPGVQDLFDSWFRIADKDRDNVVSGAEAVEFFQRSGLPQETLFKVWNMVAGDNPSLSKPQFYSTLRLISLAQRSNNTLPEGQARQVLIGVGPTLPPPRMVGLEFGGPGQQANQPLPAWSGAPPVAAAPAYARPPQPPLLPSQPGFLPMTYEDLQKYQAMFVRMDNDRDGFVQGGDCFGAFMQWGLPKEVLKDIWAVVAGDVGVLNQLQFVQCLYLMDNAKRGVAPPRQLPSGPFPPMQGMPQPEPIQPFSVTEVQQGANFDVFSQQLPFPDLPPRAAYQPPPPVPYVSNVPAFNTGKMGNLGAADKHRLATEREAAQAADQILHKERQRHEDAKAKERFYSDCLQALTLFKAKTSAALLQVQEHADKDAGEAEAVMQRYETEYTKAGAMYTKGKTLLADIQKARARKLEAETKLRELMVDIEQISNLSPAQVQKDEAETSKIYEDISRAEARRAALEMQAAALREEKGDLQRELEEVRLSVAAAEADVANAHKELRNLREQLRAEDRGSVTELQALLKSTADVYRNLVQHAQKVNVPVPPEALLGDAGRAPKVLAWDEYAVAGAADWDDFKDEGFKVVNALPWDSHYPSPSGSFTSLNNRSPSPLDTPPLSKAASAKPPAEEVPPEAFGFTAKFGDALAANPDPAAPADGESADSDKSFGFTANFNNVQPIARRTSGSGSGSGNGFGVAPSASTPKMSRFAEEQAGSGDMGAPAAPASVSSFGAADSGSGAFGAANSGSGAFGATNSGSGAFEARGPSKEREVEPFGFDALSKELGMGDFAAFGGGSGAGKSGGFVDVFDNKVFEAAPGSGAARPGTGQAPATDSWAAF